MNFVNAIYILKMSKIGDKTLQQFISYVSRLLFVIIVKGTFICT
jgi:hypothetical protein